MKKFVGLVNGKSFDNEKDFNDAADKAIKENDGTLSISSYYTYTSDNVEENKDDDKFVSTSEYYIGTRKPDKVDKDSIEYIVPSELKNRIKTATNKDSIERNLNHHILKLDDQITTYENQSLSLQKDIENLQNKLYAVVEESKDLKGRKKYYDEIINIINESDNEHKVEEKTKDGDKKPDNVEEKKNKIRKVLDVDPDTSLFTFLTQLGFFK